MNFFEENAVRIANYLEEKMSSSEEEAFIQEMESNENLRQQYEDELLVSELLHNQKEEFDEAGGMLFQPAEQHINMIKAALEKKEPLNKKVSVIKLFSNYKIAVAASFITIVLSLIFLLQKKKSNVYVTTVKTSVPKDSSQKNDLLTDTSQLQAGIDKRGALKDSVSKTNVTLEKKKHSTEQLAKQNTLKDNTKTDWKDTAQIMTLGNLFAESTFKKLYVPYTDIQQRDPVEISEYYKSYKDGNYLKILSSKDEDYQLMGGNERNNLLKQYMQFYKGLSYLAQNRPADAIQKFDAVLQSTTKTTHQYYEAQWYSVLAWLKIGNTNKAATIAEDITKTSSTYRFKATQLLKELNFK